uniref:Cullin-4B-like n=1 Tax=Diabrotica virgifera virgifera TaxID=50390 RepID=A0A6P7GT09_DIAVI
MVPFVLGEPRLPPHYMEDTWDKLKSAVIAIQNATGNQYALEELYQAVANMCNHKMAPIVYDRLYDLVEVHVAQNIEQFLAESMDRLLFLKKMNDTWSAYCNQMKMIRSIFLHLDRTYVLQNSSQLMSIWDMGLETFSKYILLNTLVQTRVVEGLLMLIEKERQGDQVDRTLLKSLLRMLTDLQIYDKAFEQKFLQATERLFAAEGQRLIQLLDIPDYLNHVDKRIKEERDRVIHYLNDTTEKQLIHTVEKQLISEHISQILQKGLRQLMNENRISDLTLLYTLLARVKNGTTELCTAFNGYIKTRGKTIVIDPEKDKSMVQELLDFKDAMDNVVSTCFAKNEKFTNSLKEAFEHFVNQRTNKPAELIGKYISSAYIKEQLKLPYLQTYFIIVLKRSYPLSFYSEIFYLDLVNLIGRLQLSTERSQLEDNQSIVQLRILRTQEAIIKILKMRKKISNAALQAELVDILMVMSKNPIRCKLVVDNHIIQQVEIVDT